MWSEFDEEVNMFLWFIIFCISKYFNFFLLEKCLELKIEFKDYIIKIGVDVIIKLYVKGLVEEIG